MGDTAFVCYAAGENRFLARFFLFDGLRRPEGRHESKHQLHVITCCVCVCAVVGAWLKRLRIRQDK